MAQKPTLSGNQKFEQYYSQIFNERWDVLKQALLRETNPVSLSDKLLTPYYIDKASIIVANLLPILPNSSVLDMCAAPGGKSLVLAQKLDDFSTLTANDRSASRRNRLIKVIQNSLPTEIQSKIKITGYDSTKWSLYQKNAYNSILLDAPCSSERHVINDANALSQWSPNRPKQLAIQQFAMLAAALDCVVPSGFILYSTCSINPFENNMVIEKLFKKRCNRVKEIAVDVPCAEKLQHGSIIMPDTTDGLGPMYFCLLRRIE